MIARKASGTGLEAITTWRKTPPSIRASVLMDLMRIHDTFSDCFQRAAANAHIPDFAENRDRMEEGMEAANAAVAILLMMAKEDLNTRGEP